MTTSKTAPSHYSHLATLTLAILCFGCRAGTDSPSPDPTANTPAKPPVPMERLMDAALDGDVDMIKEAIQTRTDINMMAPDRRTALMLAAFNGHAKVVELLTAAGAKVDIRDITGRTALMYASTSTNAATVAALLANGADVNAADTEEHFTPLMWAAAEGHTEICRLLLDKGADPNTRDVDGDKASTFAAQKGHTALVAILQAAEKGRP